MGRPPIRYLIALKASAPSKASAPTTRVRTGTATFSNDMDKDAAYMWKDVGKVVEKGVFVDGFLHGRGKVTFPEKGKKGGIFVNGKLDNGTTTFSSSVVLVKPLASTPVRLLAVHPMELAQ
ncbi:hypothetical protein THAOC_25399 [Thalassiosira oceanica]|uniref:Uncharacterized protein n=1 Tax=Thalassiosira oceanica TaxID=159749 RepID=K0S7X2_THAOC|nr:hypothetical protein THAOC_25399 [Thalassiosira oceanica]|eukprot:EJK54927.1 hypothetical protein THAOC_25399 [Thalassiosira oceanica]